MLTSKQGINPLFSFHVLFLNIQISLGLFSGEFFQKLGKSLQKYVNGDRIMLYQMMYIFLRNKMVGQFFHRIRKRAKVFIHVIGINQLSLFLSRWSIIFSLRPPSCHIFVVAEGGLISAIIMVSYDDHQIMITRLYGHLLIIILSYNNPLNVI